MKTVSLSKGVIPNKKKKKQLIKDPDDFEISVNKSAKFNFNEQCNFDIPSKKRKLGNDERTGSTNENRTENILDVDKSPKKNKRKSNKSEFFENEKDLQIGVSNKDRRNKSLDNVDEEEEAESIDSGCVDDGSTESLTEALELPTDWTQILSSVVAEHSYVQDILSVVPSRKQFDISDYIEDTDDSKKLVKPKTKDTTDKANAKPTRVANYEELTKRLEEKLHKLKKNRNTKKERIKTRRQQQKLKNKMKILCTKNKKRNKVEDTEPETEGAKKKASIQSGDGQLVFSKFDFSKPVSAKQPANKGKDLQHLLSKALKEKEKVKKLETGGDLERATEVKDKKAWKGALMRADGQKVLDDIDLLKKSVKKKEQKKKSSKDKWEKRNEKLKEKMHAEEKKRKDNIRGRKQDKLKNKMKKMHKKGHIVPGF
ncbi:unnamed protein product [Meganyctiphanes norvegica]|uniref:Ribosomal RNA-processing protein 14/surfeit locus protein 6 C-terminal domain-containing protein n=1 Tax=Meganyctiphanes norvegica TaxID=48144 RepID=A0AAV2QP48_MEGNR